jgi:hypothetical protein
MWSVAVLFMETVRIELEVNHSLIEKACFISFDLEETVHLLDKEIQLKIIS